MTLPFLDLPIVLAPMGGAANVALVAAVSNAGGFGILPCAYLTPAQIRAQIAELRQATSRPFGVNLFIERLPYVPDVPRIERANERLRVYRDALGIAHPDIPPVPPETYHEQVEAILAEAPAVFTFTFGIPVPEIMASCRAAGIFTMGTATTVAEARALAAAGVDGIIAQGFEAGAHRGTFLAPVEESLVGTLALVPQVVDATRLPVFAAGGIGDGRGVAAVLALGATAAAIGTSFLLADESGIPSAYRQALRAETNEHTVLTRAFSGKTARGLPNRFVDELVSADDIAPYPFQNAMTRDIRTAAGQQGRAEFLSLWAGQAAALARAAPAAHIIDQLMHEARNASSFAARAITRA